MLIFLSLAGPGDFAAIDGCGSWFAAAEQELPASAVVSYVVDGDSFQARFPDGKVGGVRLIGINAPELTDEREEVRLWAFLAKRFAAHHLAGRKVALAYDWNPRDIHGRLLVYVRHSGGREPMFNRFIIRSGFAYAFLRYPFREDYQRDFRLAQQEAAREGKGLWRKDPPPLTTPREAAQHLGEYWAVRFRCVVVQEERRYFRLAPQEEGFEVLASKDVGFDAGDASSWPGKTMIISGILEGSPGRVKVQVQFPRQIKSIGRDNFVGRE